MVEVPCENCGISLRRSKLRLDAYQHQFCSTRCSGEWKERQPSRKAVTEICIECSKAFQRLPSQGTGQFCSYSCSNAYQSRVRRGPNGASYIDGRTPFRKLVKNCKAYAAWRNAVFERDGWRCRRCSAKKGLHAHHIRSFSLLLDDFRAAHRHLDLERDKDHAVLAALKFKPFWSVRNGITLCGTCHAEEHPDVHFVGRAA
jgi:hypothetical protein